MSKVGFTVEWTGSYDISRPFGFFLLNQMGSFFVKYFIYNRNTTVHIPPEMGKISQSSR